jgi:DNA primase
VAVSGHLTPDGIAAVRARHPITDVLQHLGVELPDRGSGASDFMVSCPVPSHADSTPSCIVHPATGRYHCFGCGAHGDVLQLVCDVHGIKSLAAAVEYLESGSRSIAPCAAMLRARPPQHDTQPRPPDLTRTGRDRILEINEAAWQLLTREPAAAQARAYLARRGIDVAALEAQVGEPLAGYTPAHRDGLVRALHAGGFSTEEILDSGWAVLRDDVAVDRFRRRVVMPIRDESGHLLGVAARDLTGMAKQKYLNTPRTAAFHKGECIYTPLWTTPGTADVVVVCEGTLDALAIATRAMRDREPGVISAAPSGTALTPSQVQRIGGLGARRILLCADSDDAGRAATKKWRDLFRAAGRSTAIATVPQGHDPASWLQSGGSFDVFLGIPGVRSGVEAAEL